MIRYTKRDTTDRYTDLESYPMEYVVHFKKRSEKKRKKGGKKKKGEGG
jgi:hypothetical protein